MNVSRVFPMIGVIAGAVFIFVNAGGLDDPWSLIARIVGGVAVIAAAWFGIIRRRDNPPTEVTRRSIRTYWLCVAAEAVAIPVGANLISNVWGHPELGALWVVFVVGAHFLPAKAFGYRSFTTLGITMIVVALAGAALALSVDAVAAPSGAVLAGFILLGFTSMAGKPAPVGV